MLFRSWNDPNMVNPPPYNFEGAIHTIGGEYRVITPQDREWIVRGGYLSRHEQGSKTDPWGTYRTESEYTGLTMQAGLDDLSRYRENVFSRYRVLVGFDKELSTARTSTWTDNSGKQYDLSEEAESINALHGSLYVDWLSDDKKLVSLSSEAWGQLREESKRVGKLTGYVGFIGDSFKIGYQLTSANYGDGHVWGYGPAWIFDFNNLYRYIKRGYDPLAGDSSVFSDPNGLLSKAPSKKYSQQPEEGQSIFSNPNGLLGRSI